MKFIREASDLHLEYDIDRFCQPRILDLANPNEEMDMLWFPVRMEADFDTTYILAGDIWIDGRFVNRKWKNGDTWILRLSRRFKYVIVVLGNHDYWDRNVLYEVDKLKKSIADQGITNVFLLEKEAVVLDQVKFIGGTLWTDFNRYDPMVLGAASRIMNDYHYIKYGKSYRKLRPMDLYEIHQNTKRFIFENAKRDYPEQKVIVVTHMGPSFQSISPYYRQSSWLLKNFLYYYDLEKRIMADGQDINYWFHGHMHHNVKYDIGNVTVILNPRGYEDQNKEFEATFQIPV